MELHRLFIGMPLPEEYQNALKSLSATLRPLIRSKCTWTRPGNWHITLKFLGDTPVAAIAAIDAALAGMVWQAFPFAAGGGGFFPSPVRPRVLWVGTAKGGREMSALAAGIGNALTAVGIAPEARPFTAHLTLARIRHPGREARPERREHQAHAVPVEHPAYPERPERPERSGREEREGRERPAGHTSQPSLGDNWRAVLETLQQTRWPETVMERFVLWRSLRGGGEAGERPGPPGPRYVPVGTYAASG